MISQKLISFKINDDLLSGLDDLSLEYGVKRNKMLNVLRGIGISNLKGNRRNLELTRVYSTIVFLKYII